MRFVSFISFSFLQALQGVFVSILSASFSQHSASLPAGDVKPKPEVVEVAPRVATRAVGWADE